MSRKQQPVLQAGLRAVLVLVLATGAFAEPVLVFGHRGYSALAPENTLAAFDAAVAEGFDGVELDLRRSQDGVAVVLHDATLDRTTAASGRVEAFPLEVLRDQVGLPTLEQVLTLLGSSDVYLAIEIKSSGLEETVVRQLARLNPEKLRIMSFSKNVLQRVHRLNPDLKRVRLVWGPFGFGGEFEGLSMPYWAYRLSRAAALAWHRSGKELLVWGIPSLAAAKRVMADGVSAVVLDFLPSR